MDLVLYVFYAMYTSEMCDYITPDRELMNEIENILEYLGTVGINESR